MPSGLPLMGGFLLWLWVSKCRFMEFCSSSLPPSLLLLLGERPQPWPGSSPTPSASVSVALGPAGLLHGADQLWQNWEGAVVPEGWAGPGRWGWSVALLQWLPAFPGSPALSPLSGLSASSSLGQGAQPCKLMDTHLLSPWTLWSSSPSHLEFLWGSVALPLSPL